MVPADGTGPAVSLAGEGIADLNSISSDGSTLVFMQVRADIATLSLDGDAQPATLVGSSFEEGSGMLSPNDRWLAYVSNESGREEVYVQSFPNLGHKTLVSVGGGREPTWSKDGSELFYRQGSRMMAVTVSGAEGFEAGVPRELFDRDFWPALRNRAANYDVHPDGKRFVMLENHQFGGFPDEIHVILNWHEELKRRVPVDN